jgi:hypothetical protein
VADDQLLAGELDFANGIVAPPQRHNLDCVHRRPTKVGGRGCG